MDALVVRLVGLSGAVDGLGDGDRDGRGVLFFASGLASMVFG